ncbi:hypothetical protein OEZ86_005273 [Tetradesmus obliquus]|nr:hypothetical protein OEZ86_005273 [Tetradesmus obliquus]
MIAADGKLPPYNEEVVRQALQQTQSYAQIIQDLIQAAQAEQEKRQRQQQQGDGSKDEADAGNATTAEDAGAIIVYHETILKLKRILLNYMRMRADCLIRVRWQQRMLRAEVAENTSPAESEFFKEYDKALNEYMGTGENGIGMDLTLDLTPPKDANVRVMVLRDHGSITFSHSASVPLVKGSVHNLKCSEAEHLVRLGVLQVLDPNC